MGLVAQSHGAGRTKGERLRASRERDARNQPHHTQTSRLADCPRGSESERRAGPRAARPFRLRSRDAIRLSLPQAKVLNRRRQGLRLVALAIARDLCGILLKAVVVQDFAIGC